MAITKHQNQKSPLRDSKVEPPQPANNQNNHQNNSNNQNHQQQQQQPKTITQKPQVYLNKEQETKTKIDEQTSNNKSEQTLDVEIDPVKKFLFDCLLYIIKAIITIYDLLSQPIYYFLHNVHKRQYETDIVERSCKIDPDDINSPWRQINLDPTFSLAEEMNKFQLYDSMMSSSFKKFAKQPCYAYRKLLNEKWTKKADSDKLLRQVALSEYNWVTFDQFEQQIEAARRGFLLQGIKAGDKVVLYAETRPEWQISSQAIIRIGAIVTTMYSTLGVDGIIHCVNETGVTHVISQKDKVNKLLKLKSKLPKLKKIIYFASSVQVYLPDEEVEEKTKIQANGVHKKEEDKKTISSEPKEWLKDFEHPEVECISFNEVVALGVSSKDKPELIKLEEESLKISSKRTRDSTAVIMYTSGSTGIPKGVLMSHGNIIATCKSFSYVVKEFLKKPHENVCAAYLPLAHVFEFCIQSMIIYHGVRYGFATPHTLTDKSPGLLAGQQGDLTLLKPTVLIIVPLILDRIVQGVKQVLKAKSYFMEQLVTYLISYKIYWQKKHYETPIVNKIVCSKIATALGGRAKYVISGSAPLSSETQTFVRAALNIKLPQGFGTTETCAATTCQLFEDQSTGNVGLPVPGALIKLEPWLEGNYRPSDKPCPRGEIVVGGDMIAHGYFNLDEQTKEAFYVDEKGMRWYRTGDIGEFLPNGNLRIIDRKKDLVKLQNGEYISLGRVESTLKSNPFTDNFCAYADSNYNYIVALGPANETAIRNLAQQLVDSYLRRSPSFMPKNEDRDSSMIMKEHQLTSGIKDLKEILASYESDKLNNNEDDERDQHNERKMSSLSTTSTIVGGVNERLQRLCDNVLIKRHVMDHIRGIARERNLMSLEVPRKLLLLAEEWTEDRNLVTAAMKIRRNYIYKQYEQELKQLYSSS